MGITAAASEQNYAAWKMEREGLLARASQPSMRVQNSKPREPQPTSWARLVHTAAALDLDRDLVARFVPPAERPRTWTAAWVKQASSAPPQAVLGDQPSR
jgi:hypothetical protein